MTMQNSTDERHSTDENHPTDKRLRDEKPVELTPIEARQGVLGRPVLVVLIVGLVLAMLAWGAVEIWGTSIAPEKTVNDGTATAPASQQNDQVGGQVDGQIDDNPPSGDKRRTEPALVDPQPTGNQ